MQAFILAYANSKPYSLHMTREIIPHPLNQPIRFAAVLTGDLVNSTTIGTEAADGAMAAIETVARTERNFSRGDVRFARFRGDGWQVYAEDGSSVFRLTMLILATLRHQSHLAQTRLAAATGPVAVLPASGLASATGEVFSLSGHGLDDLTTQRLVYESRHSTGNWHRALFTYLDWQSSRWSAEQAEAVALAFRYDPPRTHSVALDLGISRQAAQSRLKGAGFEPLAEAAYAFAALKDAP